MSRADTRKKAVLMLSGGLDSTVAAFLAADDHDIVCGLTYEYGQRAARRELGAGYGVASALGVTHRTVFLPFFREFASGALTDPSQAVPEPTREELDDVEGAARRSADLVWVPNRNGVFIAVGAAWAESLGADVLVVGFNAEEARTFPDNTADFVAAQNRALSWSTRSGVEVLAPTVAMTKETIVRVAVEREVPLELVWPCYDGDVAPCGRCESCGRFDRAVDRAAARPWLNSRREKARRR